MILASFARLTFYSSRFGHRGAVSLWIFLGMLGGTSPAAPLAILLPTQSLCEYLANPIGIYALQPRLSWVLHSDLRAQAQTAYQILVSSSEANLKANKGDLWDSGKIVSDQQNQIGYTGKPLVSGQACFWKARVWDKAATASNWSEPARWEMGLLSPEDWKGKWIGRTT